MASSYDSSSEDDGPKAGRQFDREQSAFDLSGQRGASESTMLDSVISTNERNRERELQSRLEVMQRQFLELQERHASLSRAREQHSGSSSSSSRKGKGQGEAQRKQSERRKQARHSNGNAPQHPSCTPMQSTLQVWQIGGQPFLGHSSSRTIVPAVHKNVDNRRLVLGAGSQVHGGIAFGDNTSTSTSTVTNNNNNGSGGGGGKLSKAEKIAIAREQGLPAMEAAARQKPHVDPYTKEQMSQRRAQLMVENPTWGRDRAMEQVRTDFGVTTSSKTIDRYEDASLKVKEGTDDDKRRGDKFFAAAVLQKLLFTKIETIVSSNDDSETKRISLQSIMYTQPIVKQAMRDVAQSDEWKDKMWKGKPYKDMTFSDSTASRFLAANGMHWRSLTTRLREGKKPSLSTRAAALKPLQEAILRHAAGPHDVLTYDEVTAEFEGQFKGAFGPFRGTNERVGDAADEGRRIGMLLFMNMNGLVLPPIFAVKTTTKDQRDTTKARVLDLPVVYLLHGVGGWLSVSRMIECNGNECPGKWYHQGCLNLSNAAFDALSTETWLCQPCSSAGNARLSGRKRKAPDVAAVDAGGDDVDWDNEIKKEYKNGVPKTGKVFDRLTANTKAQALLRLKHVLSTTAAPYPTDDASRAAVAKLWEQDMDSEQTTHYPMYKFKHIYTLDKCVELIHEDNTKSFVTSSV